MSRTVRVRIAVAVDPTGDWSSAGWKSADPGELHSYAIDTLEVGERRYWLEADLEIPEIPAMRVEPLPAGEGE